MLVAVCIAFCSPFAWKNNKIYITDGAAALTAMQLPAGTEVVMSHYQQVCSTTLLHWQQELRKGGRFVGQEAEQRDLLKYLDPKSVVAV